MKPAKLTITKIHDEFDLPYMRLSDGSHKRILNSNELSTLLKVLNQHNQTAVMRITASEQTDGEWKTIKYSRKYSIGVEQYHEDILHELINFIAKLNEEILDGLTPYKHNTTCWINVSEAVYDKLSSLAELDDQIPF